jgi:hypothetical protein
MNGICALKTLRLVKTSQGADIEVVLPKLSDKYYVLNILIDENIEEYY